MGGNWFRVNSLYKIRHPNTTPKVSSVEFHHRLPGVLITSIGIVHYHKRQLTTINLSANPFTYHKLVKLAQPFFKEIHAHEATFSCCVPFDPAELNSFVDFFLACSALSNAEDYGDIITELTQLACTLTHLSTLYSYLRGNHVISEDLPWRTYVNPQQSDSMQLVNLISNPHPSDQTKKEILRELMHGSPLDQRHPETGNTLFHSAIFRPLSILNLLLAYCPRDKKILTAYSPFPRYETVFETAKRLGDKEKFHALTTFYFPPQRLFPQRNTLITVSRIASASNGQRIISILTCNITQANRINKDLSQKALLTVIKRTDQLTIYEKPALWKVFQACFPNVIDSKKERLFNQELANSRTFLELIFNKEEVIGCNIFQLEPHSKDENTLIFAIRLSMLHPSYHQYRLMSLLSFRPLLSLQLALEKKIIGHFTALNEYSFKIIAKGLFYPKYQDLHYWNSIKEEVISKMNYPWCYQEDTICYVPDELGIRRENPTSDLQTEFFYNYILGGSGERAGLILFPVGDNSFEIISDNLSTNLNFTAHVKEFSGPLLSFLQANSLIPPCRKKSIPSLANSRDLFWNNKITAYTAFDKETIISTKNCRL